MQNYALKFLVCSIFLEFIFVCMRILNANSRIFAIQITEYMSFIHYKPVLMYGLVKSLKNTTNPWFSMLWWPIQQNCKCLLKYLPSAWLILSKLWVRMVVKDTELKECEIRKKTTTLLILWISKSHLIWHLLKLKFILQYHYNMSWFRINKRSNKLEHFYFKNQIPRRKPGK